MLRNNNLAYIILTIVMSIPLGLYIKNYNKIINNSKFQYKSQIPLLKLILSGIFVIIGCMGFIFRFPWYIDLFKYIAIQYSILFSYSANMWILNQQYHDMRKDFIFWITNIFQFISILAGFYSHNNLGLIISEESFIKTPLYYIHYLFALLSYTIVIPFILFYTHKSIVQSKNIIYKARRSIVFVSYISCLFGSSLMMISLILSIMFDDKYIHIINTIYLPTIPLYGIIPFANMIPESFISRIINPIIKFQKRKSEKQYHAITQLHAIITAIVPNVRMNNIPTGYQRKLIEIGDARDLIMSQTVAQSQHSAATEAALFLHLFQQRTQILTAGTYPVPLLDDAHQHFIVVGTHLLPANTLYHQPKELLDDTESSQHSGV